MLAKLDNAISFPLLRGTGRGYYKVLANFAAIFSSNLLRILNDEVK